METIGQLIQETLDLANRNLFEEAFVPLSEAVNQTAQKIFENDDSPKPAPQRFISQNWRLISFMGIPATETIPSNLPFSIRRAVASLNSRDVIEQLVVYIVRQTLVTRRLPLEIGFNKVAKFAIENNKLLLPRSLFFAVIGSIVLHPVNKNETIPDEYWLHIRDFKMFISELWGRADLAERIMKLYFKA